LAACQRRSAYHDPQLPAHAVRPVIAMASRSYPPTTRILV